MNSKIFIPIIAALAGAFVGALIKELASFYYAHREDHRILKIVLFNQLDVWYELKRCDTGPVILPYFEKIEERMTKEGSSREQIDSLLKNVRPQLQTLFCETRIGEPEKLQQRYQASVNDLARVDPILAYRLSGKPNFESTQAKMDAYLDKAIELESNQSAKEIVRGLRDHLGSIYKEKLLKQAIETLEKDMRSVSRRIGLITRIRVSGTLKKLEKKVKSETYAEADKVLDLMIDYLRNVAKGANA